MGRPWLKAARVGEARFICNTLWGVGGVVEVGEWTSLKNMQGDLSNLHNKAITGLSWPPYQTLCLQWRYKCK